MELNTRSLDRDLADLQSRVESALGAQMDNRALRQMAQQITENIQRISELQSVLENTAKTVMVPSMDLSELDSQIAEVQQSLRDAIQSQDNKIANWSDEAWADPENVASFEAMDTAIQQMRDSLAQLQAQRDQMVASGGAEQVISNEAYTQAQAEIEALTSDTQTLMTTYEQATSVEDESASSTSRLASAFYSLGNGFKAGINGAKKLGDTLKNKLQKNATSAFRSIKQLVLAGLGIRGISSLVNKLKSAATAAIKDMAKQIPEVNDAISSIKTALNGLKGSAGTMIQPLLNAFAPAIVSLINLLAKGITMAGQFFAALTGQKYIYKATAAQENYAKSLGKTNKQLGKFDELNNISTQSGGAEVATYEKEEVPDSFVKLKEWLKDMWDLGDFTQFGAALGKKLQDALNSIDWEPIWALGKKIGSSIATLINGFVEVPDLGFDIGATLAKWQDTIIYTIESFLDNLHAISVGDFFGDMVNGWFSNIDWGALGHTIGLFFSKLSEILVGFAMTLDVGKIVDSVIEFLKGIDWVRVAGDIALLVYAALKLAFELVLSLIAGIADLLAAGFKAIGLDSVAGFFAGISEKIKAAKDFMVGVFTEIVDAIKDFLGIHSPSTLFADIGINVIKGLINGISGTIGKVKEIFTQAWEAIKVVTTNIFNAIKVSITEKINSIKSGISSAMSSVQSTWSNIWTNMKNTVVNIFSGIWNAIRGTINSILSGIQTMANGIVSGINKVIASLNTLRFNIPDWVPEVGGNSIGFNIPYISQISLPRLAEGAVIPPNKEFLAVLGDQKNGTNIETPLSTMIEAFNAASKGSSEEELRLMREQNDLLRQLLVKDVGIDSNDLFNSVRNSARIYKTSTGLSAF